jgi:nitrite reductase/ring-hydroxylating ferredoxin subunit
MGSGYGLRNCNEFPPLAITGGLDRKRRAVLCRSVKRGPQRPCEGEGITMADNVVRVCAQSEIAPETVKAYEIGDKRLAVYNLEGQFYVTDDECTHASASLADGFLEDGIIECSLHSGAFDVKTGAVKSPPCSFALRTYKVVLEGDDILVDLDKDAAGEPA